ncbi:MAG: putative toxin-antitoxin system toxin component, PIN family [Desulfotomaculales bacterium]
MRKAVLDTNVLISGLISPRGTPAKLLAAWRAGKFELVVSPKIIAEINEVLPREKIKRYFHHFGENLPGKFIAGLKRLAKVVPGEREVKIMSADPDDDMFIAAAVESEADYVVSGNKHLLELNKYQGIKIITPAEFLRILELS